MNAEIIEVGQGRARQLFSAANILYVEGDCNYSRFFLKDGRLVMSSKHLKHYEALLPSLIRTHKSYLINPAYIKGLYQKGKHPGEITLLNGVVVPSSRRRNQAVKERLGI
ncbi:LytR/AlgR family response regulator transcription factor [Spirosoma horti]